MRIARKCDVNSRRRPFLCVLIVYVLVKLLRDAAVIERADMFFAHAQTRPLEKRKQPCCCSRAHLVRAFCVTPSFCEDRQTSRDQVE